MTRVSPPGTASRLGIRLRQRKSLTAGDDDPGMTAVDEDNLARFGDLIREAVVLLEEENQALEAGDVAQVAARFEAKKEILKSLELQQPVVEPFLASKGVRASDLREIIARLSAVLKRNSELLDGMAAASRTIIKEVERIRSRNSLDGLYDKSGQLRQEAQAPTQRIETKL